MGDLVQLPIVPVLGQGFNWALYNEGTSSSTFRKMRISYGSRIHSPFSLLAVGTEERQRMASAATPLQPLFVYLLRTRSIR